MIGFTGDLKKASCVIALLRCLITVSILVFNRRRKMSSGEPVMPVFVKPNRHKMEWCAKKTVMETILKHNGTLFGGAVRDWYIHDMYAERFYDAFTGSTEGEKDNAYADPAVFPEFVSRQVMPRDIDATIDDRSVLGLIHGLRAKGFQVFRLFSRDAKRYIPSLQVEEGDLEHQGYAIQYLKLDFEKQMTRMFPPWIRNDLATHDFLTETAEAFRQAFGDRRADYTIHLDLLVRKRALDMTYYDAPYSKIDFECNGLLMDGEGFRLSKMWIHSMPDVMRPTNPLKCQRMLQRVLAQIEMRVAQVVEAPMTRVEKMVSRGWTIQGFKTVVYESDKHYEGYCLICHDTLPEKHYKMTCCDARFHTKCLVRAMTTGDSAILNKKACIMCKHKHALEDLQKDSTMLATIQTAKSWHLTGARGDLTEPVGDLTDARGETSNARGNLTEVSPRLPLAPAPSILPIIMAMSLDTAHQIIQGLPNQPIMDLPSLPDEEEI